MTLVSAIGWIPRGKCAAEPKKQKLTSEEYASTAQLLGLNAERASNLIKKAIAADRKSKSAGDDSETSSSDDENLLSTDAAKKDASAIAVCEDSAMDIEGASSSKKDELSDLKEFNLDNYDDEDDEDVDSDGNEQAGSNLFTPIADLVEAEGSDFENLVSGSNDAAKNGSYEDDGHDDDDEDDDDEKSLLEEEMMNLRITPADSVLCFGTTEDEVSCVEMHVCEDLHATSSSAAGENTASSGERWNLFAHHDFLLPTIPICIEYIVASSSTNEGAYIAVAGMDPHIEIWDLDIVDAIAPAALLGNPAINKLPTKKTKKSKSARGGEAASVDSHTDSVLSLAADRRLGNYLASSSADGTVRVWDVSATRTVWRMSAPHGGAKVCGALWSPTAASCILTAGFDSTVRFSDVRMEDPSVSSSSRMAQIVVQLLQGASGTNDPEGISWNKRQADGSQFYVLTENGTVQLRDLRNTETPVWTLSAIDEGEGGAMSLSPRGDVLATAGKNGVVKFWDVTTSRPSLRKSHTFTVGNIFDCKWSPDDNGLIAVAGMSGHVVYDFVRNERLRSNEKDDEDQDDDEDGDH